MPSGIRLNQLEVNQVFITPITIEVFLYGILYVIATLVFFTLATISISLDLALRYNALTEQDTATFLKIRLGPYYIFIIASMLSDAMMLILEVLAVKTSSAEGGGGTLISTADATVVFTNQVYGCATLAENIVLTGLMAGRVWWLERRMKNILTAGKKRKVSQSLLGPIENFLIFLCRLQSGVLNPIFLSIWVGAVYSPILASFQLTPCALTQIFGISSTLIVLSIGIGIASNSQSPMSDEENRALVYENPEESVSNIEIPGLANGLIHPDHPIVQDRVHPSTDTIQPFSLKYDHDAITEPMKAEHL
ncbi:hypothetical protein BDP27DRAFT_1548187 [Rhodocollybia butyracea]|uniref:Uncharacterized protein n=1 Tax=Rhodocollybia butyracea TaxID=206335 RepID=A0A9P5U3R3_9AGAR|nr:hypothetical protein BDP27DRAFT_1548187 [Rhodocollybia butyracea]